MFITSHGNRQAFLGQQGIMSF